MKEPDKDIISQDAESPLVSDRHEDVYAWLLGQATRFRVYRPEFIDWAGLAEELEEVVAQQRATVVSPLARLQADLLKWQYSRTRRSEHSWRKTLAAIRTQLNAILDESKVLKNELSESVTKAYRYAPRVAGIEMRLEKREWERLFPTDSPWTPEQILDQDFFPELAPTANGRH